MVVVMVIIILVCRLMTAAETNTFHDASDNANDG
jgi:hypothetical protein